MSASVSPPHGSGFDGTDRSGAIGQEERTVFGQFLVAARHRSGRSLEDIAATTKVVPRLLEALERGDIEQLPAGVYRRAIVKNYAVAIGLNPDAALERFDRTFNPVPVDRRGRAVAIAPREPGRPAPTLLRIGRSRFAILAAALVAVVVAGVTVPSLLRSEQTASSAPRDASPVNGLASEPSSLDPSATASTGQSTTVEADSLDSEPAPVVPSAPHLIITSNPSGARVTVNGIGWGVTPVTIRNLPPGQKAIRVTKDGYVGRETTVQFGVTDGNATVRLTLQPQD